MLLSDQHCELSCWAFLPDKDTEEHLKTITVVLKVVLVAMIIVKNYSFHF